MATEQQTVNFQTAKISVIDFWRLMKPELTTLSVFTSLASAYLALKNASDVSIITFIFLIIGTMLVGGGCGALNQYMEWEYDAKMKRTEKRPIPAQRISPRSALMYGITISILGCSALFFINIYAGILAIATLVSYLFLYTPLKSISTVSTVIGAFPGALPVLIGWVSIEKSFSLFGIILFAVLFYWQMPHFYALAWMYRNDYSKAGFRLITIIDSTGSRVSSHIIVNLIVLIVISTLPFLFGTVNLILVAAVMIVGLYFLLRGIIFAKNIQNENSQKNARKLFFTSLIYLPLYFSLLVLDKLFK